MVVGIRSFEHGDYGSCNTLRLPGTSAGPCPRGSTDLSGLQELRDRVRLGRKAGSSGVLQHRLHARGLVPEVEFSSFFVRDVGVEPAYPSRPVFGFREPRARNLYFPLGDVCDLLGRGVRGCGSLPYRGRDGPRVQRLVFLCGFLQEDSGTARLSEVYVDLGQVTKGYELAFLVSDLPAQPERGLQARTCARVLPELAVAPGQTAQDVGFGLRVFQIAQQPERLPTGPERFLEVAQAAVDHAQPAARQPSGARSPATPSRPSRSSFSPTPRVRRARGS